MFTPTCDLARSACIIGGAFGLLRLDALILRHRDHIRSLRVRNMNLDLKVDGELETFTAFRRDLAELRVQIVRLRYYVGPVQRDDEGGHDHRLVTARVDRILPGPQRILPDTPMSRAHQA